MSSGGDGNPRRPHDMQGLLKFCIEQTKNEDNTEPTQFAPLSEERRAFLKEVLESLQGNDPIKAMLGHIQVILENGSSLEDRTQALEDLEEYCEDMDLACDFHKIGGYEFLQSQLASSEPGVRWRAAELIAIVVQNNPYCQQRALEQRLVPALLTTLDQDEDDQVRVKALYALSSLCRDFPEGQAALAENDGFSVILRAMQTPVEKLQIKGAFMLRSLCASQHKYKDELVSMGMVEHLVALLSQPHSASHEHVLRLLLELARDHAAATAECRRHELRLRELLTSRQQELKGKDEHLEEYESAKSLQDLVFGSSQGSTLDR